MALSLLARAATRLNTAQASVMASVALAKLGCPVRLVVMLPCHRLSRHLMINRQITTGIVLRDGNKTTVATSSPPEAAVDSSQNEGDNNEAVDDGNGNVVGRRTEAREYDPKDRSRVVPVDISIKYMESTAYKDTYGESKVWELYRRNFAKGNKYQTTRKKCIRDGRLDTGNPCPICRDEFLVVDYRNVKLLQQFFTDYNGEVLTSQKTGVCQEKWMKIRVELEKAKDHGYLRVDPPFVVYDYDKYKPVASATDS